ncbi:transposable element Tcb1 transposase [Trichonephila clavipes]|uniref:Transposable element Tcb1 transposase n=1 Tax=Trichonephila clavipes TaxID=2585209 RepID=A0A8X6R8Q1_TRICX|nr:transposable element Tcb1 transposase [Trichonephila clavipes]
MQRFQGAIFQQDNAVPHTARVSQDFLRTVTTLPWPARCPDLSPIEHIWDHLGWQVGHPTSLNELEAKLQQIWNEISRDIIQNLYASMPDCIASCIRARGGSTGRDFQACAANTILSQTSTADLTIDISDLFVSHTTLQLPLSHTLTATIASVSNTGLAEIHLRPADAEQGRVVRRDVEQMEHVTNNLTVCQYHDY